MDITSPRHLKIANWSVLAVLVLGGFLWLGREFALGVLVGGLVVVINFHLLHQALQGTLGRIGQAPPGGRQPGQGLVRLSATVALFCAAGHYFSVSRSRLGQYLRIAGGPVHGSPDPDAGRASRNDQA